MEVARDTLRNRDAADPDGAKKKILDAFSSLGIKPAELKKFLGHGTDILSPKETEDLRGIYRAIKDGEATWADYIENKEGQEKPPGPEVDPAAVEEFDQLVKNECKEFVAPVKTQDEVFHFVSEIAKTNKLTVEAVKAQAGTAEHFPTFWASFLKWNSPDKKPPGRPKKDPPSPPPTPTPPEGKDAAGEGSGAEKGIPGGITEETLSLILHGIKVKDLPLDLILQDWECSSLEGMTEEIGKNVLAWIAGQK